MTAWNTFRILADLAHATSKGILIVSIHRNRSAEGVSFIFQILYALVFCTRYIDVFWEKTEWNFIFKVAYLGTSFYTLAIMQWLYPRSRERELSWKMGALILAGTFVLSPIALYIFESKRTFVAWMWVFSEILESVCVLPQLLLLRQTTVPTVINSFYLLALGSYRGLYCINWLLRAIQGDNPDAVSVIFGIIQTALYIDFAWVYYSRQRVKLRGGGIVDADDMRRGWLLQRIFGKRYASVGEDDEEGGLGRGYSPGEGAARGASRTKWGARGISVSADDGVLETERHNREDDEGLEGAIDPDARMKDPDELARALDDDEDHEDTPLRAGQSSSSSSNGGGPGSVQAGSEWRD